MTSPTRCKEIAAVKQFQPRQSAYLLYQTRHDVKSIVLVHCEHAEETARDGFSLLLPGLVMALSIARFLLESSQSLCRD
jgi:hypothetical protein